MDTFAERLRLAMAGPPKIKQVELAAACGIKPPSVSDWLNGRSVNIEGKNLLAASKLMNVRPEWLSKGIGPMRQDSQKQANVETVPASMRRLVPLISWVRAGDLCQAEDPYQPGDAEAWLPCPFDRSEQAFCLRVVGDSMSPDYREDEYILVDPARQPEHGDDVVVRTPDSTCTFKRLQITPDGTYLLAVNTDHPERKIKVPEGTVICGVVTGSWITRSSRKNG